MRFLSLASRNCKEIYRDPLSLSLGIGMPAGFLVLFVSIAKRAPLEIFTVEMMAPGVITFSFAFLIMFSSVLLAKDRQSAFLTRLLTTPLQASDFILAYILPLLPIALAQVTVCYGIGFLLGLPFGAGIFASFIILVPTAVACIGLGMILGTLFNEKQVAGIGAILINAIGLLSGIWLDLKMAGGVIEAVGRALPFSHAVDASRAILKGAGFGAICVDFYWVLGYSLILFLLGVVCFQGRTRE